MTGVADNDTGLATCGVGLPGTGTVASMPSWRANANASDRSLIGSGRHADGRQHRVPVVGAVGLQRRFEQGAQRIPVRDPQRVGRESGVVGESGQADRRGQRRELLVVADGHRDGTVGGVEGLVGGDARVAVAHHGRAPRRRPDSRRPDSPWTTTALRTGWCRRAAPRRCGPGGPARPGSRSARAGRRARRPVRRRPWWVHPVRFR